MIPERDIENLFTAAKEARGRAYAPYSSFSVGAALLFDNGEVITGCNVENGSYGLTLCAERNAMTAAVLKGLMSPLAIAIVGKEGTLCPPCGACRQFLAEFNPDMCILMEDCGKIVAYRLAELLPLQFFLDQKGDGQ